MEIWIGKTCLDQLKVDLRVIRPRERRKKVEIRMNLRLIGIEGLTLNLFMFLCFGEEDEIFRVILFVVVRGRRIMLGIGLEITGDEINLR